MKKRVRRKAQIWVSAVLYIALGVIALTLVLTAAVPLINKMRDRNTITQTKELMYVLDKNIRRVASEGPGSQRELSPFIIKAGDFFIDEKNGDKDTNTISWDMETTAMMLEPGIAMQEGTLNLLLEETAIEGRYKINLGLSYENIAELFLNSDYGNPFSGRYTIIIRNTGELKNDLPVIEVRVI